MRYFFIIVFAILFCSCASTPQGSIESRAPKVAAPKEWSSRFEVMNTNQKSGNSSKPSKKIAPAKNQILEKVTRYTYIGPPTPSPFEPGEKIKLSLYWLGVRLGDFTIEVLPYKFIDSVKVFDFSLTIKSSSLASMFYRIDDNVKSHVDMHSFLPLRFEITGDESKHVRKGLELYSHVENKMYVDHADKVVKTGEVRRNQGYRDLIPGSQDALSAIFSLRTMNFEIGKTTKIAFVMEGNQNEIEITPVAIEKLDTDIGEIDAYKLSMMPLENGKPRYPEPSFVYISTDHRHLPLKFIAKVKIGNIEGSIKEYTH